MSEAIEQVRAPESEACDWIAVLRDIYSVQSAQSGERVQLGQGRDIRLAKGQQLNADRINLGNIKFTIDSGAAI